VRTIPTRTKTLTLTEAAVLCLLAVEGERSGYELSKCATRSVQSDRPDKQLYEITAAGKHTLEAWLETVDPDDVDAFHLKVFYGGLMSRATLVAHVEAYRQQLHESLATYDEISERNTNRDHDYYHRLMLDYGYAHARASLAWVDEVLAKLRRRR
jgi:hypothetical protein